MSGENVLPLHEGRNFLPSRREVACSAKMLLPVFHSTFQKNLMLKTIVLAILDFFLSSAKRPHRLWGPPSLLFSGYGHSCRVKVARVWLTIRHHLVLRLRMSGAIPLLPLYAFIVSTSMGKRNFTFTFLLSV